MKKTFVLLPIFAMMLLSGDDSVGQAINPNALAIPLTVSEPAGVDRPASHVKTGVPIPLSATQSNWSLWRGNEEIPVQATLLPGVRTPWVLLDFFSTVSANASESYTLRAQPATAVSPTNVVVTDATSTATVSTGPLKVVMSKTSFNLFDEVWIDRDQDGIFAPSEQIIFQSATDNLPLRLGVVPGGGNGTVLTGRGTPDQFVWEVLGPLRSTLRIDGTYRTGGNAVIGYTVRLSFLAGSSAITIEHLLRNSTPAEERYVKVQSAKMVVGGGSTIRSTKSGSTLWANVSSAGIQIETVPSSLELSTAYIEGGSRQNTVIDVDANGGMVMGDWSYHGTTAQLDFREQLTADQQAATAIAFQDRLVALAPASWYSDQGAFGAEKFATLEDEKNAYQRWGWTWPTPGNPYSNEPLIPRVKNIYRVDWNTVDAGDFEADDVWMNLLMYVRTGSRGYLDRADGMARYWKWEFAWRSDGFSFLRNDYWSGPDRYVDFPRVDLPNGTFSANDLAYVANNIKFGKNDGNHSWGGGLYDYYYMFGDLDAFAAATDIAEQARQQSIWVSADLSGVIGGNVRGQARQLLNVTRAWEATSDQLWRTAADHLRDMFLSPTAYYDARGFYYGLTNETTRDSVNTRYPNARYLAPFMHGAAVQALYRYWLLTGDTAVRQRILALADFAMNHGVNPYGYTGDNILVDYPVNGIISHLTYDQFRHDNPVTVYPFSSSTSSYIDTLTIAYRLTGQSAYLAKAKNMWDKTSKRLGTNSYTTLLADGTHVGRFMNSLLNNGAATLYPENGDLMTAHLLFYDASRVDDTAPNAIMNLRAQ